MDRRENYRGLSSAVTSSFVKKKEKNVSDIIRVVSKREAPRPGRLKCS